LRYYEQMGSDERDALLVPKAGDIDCWVNMTVVLIKEVGWILGGIHSTPETRTGSQDRGIMSDQPISCRSILVAS
jgi:hypothetical protein